MAKNSNIEWTHHTFNPWRGCTKVSDGCKNCYAMVLSDRYKGRHGIWGPKGTRIVASDAMWREPLKWDREAEALGERHRVFCCSLADVFEDWKGPMSCGMQEFEGQHWEVTADEQSFFVRGYRDLPMHEGSRLATMDDYRAKLWRLIERTPNLDWLLLTKRPENVMGMVPEPWRESFPPNVWLGTSVEDQKTADERIPHLLRCPAAVRFLSCEPLLGPVDLRNLTIREGRFIDCLGCDYHDGKGSVIAGPPKGTGPVDWVIVGGESGPGARPMDLAWVYDIVKQCDSSGVAVFVKQLGKSFYFSAYNYGDDLLSAGAKGGDWDHAAFPEDLKIREFPEVAR